MGTGHPDDIDGPAPVAPDRLYCPFEQRLHHEIVEARGDYTEGPPFRREVPLDVIYSLHASLLELLEDVVQLLPLRLEVALVVAVGLHLDGDALGYLQPEAPQAHDFRKIVGKETYALQVEVFEDLGSDPVVPEVGGETELLVGLDRVHALILEVVGPHLVEEPDTPTFLLHVGDHAFAFLRDAPHRSLKLLAAVAAQGVQSVACQARRVDPDEDIVLALGLAHNEGNVGKVV